MVNLQSGLLYLSMSQKKWTHPFASMLQDLLARVVRMQELDIHPKALILHEVRCAMSQPNDRDRDARDHLHGADSCICHTTSETMKIEKLTCSSADNFIAC